MAIQMTQDQFAHMIQAITQSRTEGPIAHSSTMEFVITTS